MYMCVHVCICVQVYVWKTNWKSVRFIVHIQSQLLYRTPVMGIQFSYQVGCVALHLQIGS